ncbi:MAG: hypothetical protein RR053_04240 [Evtepia sp.]
MKKLLFSLLTAVLLLAMVGCEDVPSDAKIKAALDEGTMTVEDASAKGWIDDEWIEKNFDSAEAGEKIYPIDKFTTTYLDGSPASSDLICGKMCLVFFDTSEEQTMEKLELFKDNAAQMKKIGIPILGILTDDDVVAAREKLKDLPFPVIVYNEEMQTSLLRYEDILDTDLVSVFTKEGGFYSAWIMKTDSNEMLTFAQMLADEI